VDDICWTATFTYIELQSYLSGALCNAPRDSRVLGREGLRKGCNAGRPGVMAEAFHHTSRDCPVEAVPIPCGHTKHGGDYEESKSYSMTYSAWMPGCVVHE